MESLHHSGSGYLATNAVHSVGGECLHSRNFIHKGCNQRRLHAFGSRTSSDIVRWRSFVPGARDLDECKLEVSVAQKLVACACAHMQRQSIAPYLYRKVGALTRGRPKGAEHVQQHEGFALEKVQALRQALETAATNTVSVLNDRTSLHPPSSTPDAILVFPQRPEQPPSLVAVASIDGCHGSPRARCSLSTRGGAIGLPILPKRSVWHPIFTRSPKSWPFAFGGSTNSTVHLLSIRPFAHSQVHFSVAI